MPAAPGGRQVRFRTKRQGRMQGGTAQHSRQNGAGLSRRLSCLSCSTIGHQVFSPLGLFPSPQPARKSRSRVRGERLQLVQTIPRVRRPLRTRSDGAACVAPKLVRTVTIGEMLSARKCIERIGIVAQPLRSRVMVDSDQGKVPERWRRSSTVSNFARSRRIWGVRSATTITRNANPIVR